MSDQHAGPRKNKLAHPYGVSAYARTARIIHIGNKEGLLCDGRLWLDVTERVMREFGSRCKRKEAKHGK